MGLDLQGRQLRGRSFRGQDLAGADFSGAEIGGADFRNADLTGANFTRARAGLSQQTAVGYRIGAVLAAMLAGVILGATASLTSAIIKGLQSDLDLGWQVALVTLALLALLTLLALLIKRGLGASAQGLMAFASIPLLLAAIPGAPPAAPGMGLFLLLLFSGLLVGSVLLAIDLATLHSIAGWRWMAVQIALAALLAAPAIWETTVEFGNPQGLTRASALELTVAALVAVLLFALGIYISRHALTGDARFVLVHRVVVGILSRSGARFQGTNLTDARFVEAVMAHADLRGAILTRTDWLGAQQLDRARVDGTYLANPKLQALVTTKNGAGQIYDDLNLEGLNLRAANLAEASFVGSNLSQATLQQANLSGAKLVHTQLHDTDLSEASLTGAFIEHWGVSTKTRFDGIRCDYVYMHLPTAADPDPMRKPDDNADFFRAGDFTDFIAPFIRTLEYYHRQNTDPRSVTRASRTLDLMQRDVIDPAISALALQQLAQRHPEANLEIISLKASGGEKMQIRALVSDQAQRAEMSEEYHALYSAMSALPRVDLERVLSNIVHKDEQIRQLEAMVLAAAKNDSFYAEIRIKPGGTVKCLLFAAIAYKLSSTGFCQIGHHWCKSRGKCPISTST